MSGDFTSRTARVPPRHHKRRLTISKHAIERFRERVDEEFRHRDDEDLGNLLDERLNRAEFNYQVRDPRAPDDITTLRSVACRHATYYAVVRHETVVTVLDEEMARKNFDSQWSPIMNNPFEVLRGLKIASPPQSPAAPITAAPIATAPAEAPAPPPAAADPLAVAGAAYARARKQRRECESAVAAIKADLERATEALLEAERTVEETHQKLIDLAEGDPQQ